MTRRKRFASLRIFEDDADIIKAKAALEGKKICNFMSDLASEIEITNPKNEKKKFKAFRW